MDLRFGMRIHEDELIEFRWARQHSRTHFEDADVPPLPQPVTLDQFHGDFTKEYILEQWPVWRDRSLLAVWGQRTSRAAQL